MSRHLAVLVISLAVGAPHLYAQNPVITDSRRAKVEGLTSISVFVDHYAGEDDQAQRLKTEVELLLRQA
jgi:hypothetical protein